ncbi:unnamed protein product [Schistocephalus solidus]|uniref:EF-hand domain-containing protein n=1 Tax=Schistocephalus solidus TaxID=70667 RepID=A0A183T2W8_SCHSO|nr:unnamed protein product [Schistocephalus solidus]
MISSKETEVEKRARHIFLACARAYSRQEDPEGVLTVSDLPELLRQVDPALLSMDTGQQRELFRMLDTNQDGAITLAELTSALTEVDVVELLRLLLVDRPGLCYLQQRRKDDSFVHLEFGADIKPLEVSPRLLTLLLQLAKAAETVLAFRKESLFQVAVEAIEENAGAFCTAHPESEEKVAANSSVEEEEEDFAVDASAAAAVDAPLTHFRPRLVSMAVNSRLSQEMTFVSNLENQAPQLVEEVAKLMVAVENAIQTQEAEVQALQLQMESQKASHERQIHDLYEEMESKIKQECDLVTSEVLEQVAKLHVRLTETCDAIRELTASKEKLDESLLKAELNLEEKSSDMVTLQKTLEEEKRKRAIKSSGLHSELEEEYEQLLSQIATLR